MKFSETALRGAFIITAEPVNDERGFISRTWCREEFQQYGLCVSIEQCNVSFNKKHGTLRGLHYQVEPYQECKLIRCTRGAVYDVALDLRRGSPSFGRWAGVELAAGDHKSFYIPAGMAHGFLTLEDDTELFYQISQVYSEPHARGVRWDDPLFNIKWPREVMVVSERDRSWPLFTDSPPGPGV